MTVGNMNAMQPAGRERRVGEVVVGVAEALGLVGLADEGAHDAHAGDLLAQHLVHAVDALLHLAGTAGPSATITSPTLMTRAGMADEQEQRERAVLADRHDRRRRRW